MQRLKEYRPGRPRVHSQMATELLVAIKAHKKTALFTAIKMVSQMSQSFQGHPTLKHICVCTNLAGIDLSPSVYCSAYHSTTNYLSCVIQLEPLHQ